MTRSQAMSPKMQERQNWDLLNELVRRCKLTARTLLTAARYLHTMHRVHGDNKFDNDVLLMACLFLAGKVEDTMVKIKVLGRHHLQIRRQVMTDDMLASYIADLTKRVVQVESAIMQTIQFAFDGEHALDFLPDRVADLAVRRRELDPSRLLHSAKALLIDLFSTSVCLDYASVTLARACVLAALAKQGHGGAGAGTTAGATAGGASPEEVGQGSLGSTAVPPALWRLLVPLPPPLAAQASSRSVSNATSSSSTSSSTASLSSSSATATSSLPFVERFRPSSLQDIIAHKDIIDTITKLVQKNALPHLLFYGPPGTGKTTTVLAVARLMFGAQYHRMVLELNASDERGIAVVRDKVKLFASSNKLWEDSGVKLVVLDEADNMTPDAQFALRRVIEQYSKTTRFCLICNYINKIIPALQSRCTRFRFAPLPHASVVERLRDIAKQEAIAIGDDRGLDAIVTLAGGDMRRSLNTLQACHMAHNCITEDAVYQCTAQPHPRTIQLVLDILQGRDGATVGFNQAFAALSEIQVNQGLSLVDIITGVHLLLLKQKPIVCSLFIHMAEIEVRLAGGASEHVELGALLGTFRVALAVK